MYDRVVIAVDGSDEARHAARRGLHLAQAFDSTVTVLSVVPQKALRLTEIATEKTTLRQQSEQALTAIEKLAEEIGHPVTTLVTEGKPAVRISEFAAEQEADLIVVGRQGLTGIGRRLLGGVTEQILQQSTLPVFVVPSSNNDTAYSRVLITTDGSENAEAAIPHGTRFAQQFGATLHVFYAVDLQAAGGVFNAGGLEKKFVERLESIGHDAVERATSTIKESAPELTIETAVERTTSFDGAAAGIREYIQENQIDLLTMGSHGRSNLSRQLLGSVAATVLRTVDIPVLVIKRHTSEKLAEPEKGITP